MQTGARLGAALLAALSFACAPGPKRAPPPPPPPAPGPSAAPAPSPSPEPKAPLPEPPPVRVEPPSAPSPKRPAAPGGFEARVFRTPEGQRLNYRLFRPAGVDPKKRYPLVVFLHGASGRGSDNYKQLTGSRRRGTEFWTADEVQSRHPAFVVAPQADPNYAPTWVRRWRPPSRPDPTNREPLELVRLLIEALGDELPIDRQRLYLTGYSMGGFGVWIAVSRHPRMFAAATPISGGGDPTDVGDAETAIWAFHGAADRVVPARRSRAMIEALRRAGKSPRYSEYPGEGHEIWERVYSEPGLVEWLFSQRLTRE